MIRLIKEMTAGTGFVLALIILIAGFIFTTFFPKAPFTGLVTGVVGVFGAMAAQRYFKNRVDAVASAAVARFCPPAGGGA